MLQLKNSSPLHAAFGVFPDPQGIDTLYVTVKATFTMRPHVALAEEQLPPAAADEYLADPAGSSLKEAAEIHLCKLSTDVVLVGHAHAASGRSVAQSAVRLSVAERQKTAAIFGDRVWRRGGGFSAPKPFEKIPLVWERAYGGVHLVAAKGPLLAEERNPVGVGFLGRRSPDELVNKPVPNIEDPATLMQRVGDTPPPVGFAAIAPAWQSRRAFAGTYDAVWQRQRSPYLPADFDPRFFGVAVPEFTFNRYLVGGEPVQIIGAAIEGPLSFPLPTVKITINVRIAGAQQSPPVNLETVTFMPDQNRMSMVWRAAAACDKKVLRVEQIEVTAA